ncbi:hypothetical protein LOAG_05251 [Loa loa]|uniref:Uncharacterized protein n=1 Tax=Loa loa TaxID=7209 RepID=A0A1S0U0G0_LOALO|nr:hypothetical protein LOAG_05251 [Loa loa]EFO23232.1 hypothetical protein LOAG_05251 [Loa loa]
MSEERKVLTENDLEKLRARFKRRQNKFAAITTAPLPRDAYDEETFEKVDVEINPIIAETNKGSYFREKKIVAENWFLKTNRLMNCIIKSSVLCTEVNEALPRKRLLTNKYSTNILPVS